MDVLRPAIINIDGRCYRLNPVEHNEQEVAPYREEEEIYEYEDHYEDEVCDTMCSFETTATGFKTSLTIPSAYFKYIIGKKGETKRRIENETNTKILIPRQGQEGDIVIHGKDKKGVSSAKSRLDILVESARARQPFTHFLSIPVNFENCQENFKLFKEEVMEYCNKDRGIDRSIFQNPCKLHLTLGTMVLLSDTELKQAVDILQQCQTEIIRPVLQKGLLDAQFTGLEYMNDDPAEVDVLYAKIQLKDGSQRLQMLADELVEKFVASNIMFREYDRVKLHITVMNTVMRKEDPSQKPVKENASSERQSFDATNVLQILGDFDFGSYILQEVHLSERYSTTSSGYYSAAAKISLMN